MRFARFRKQSGDSRARILTKSPKPVPIPLPINPTSHRSILCLTPAHVPIRAPSVSITLMPTTTDNPAAKLPTLSTTLDPGKVVDQVDALARSGKLPEFERGATVGTFSCVAFGNPFDYALFGTAEPQPSGSGSTIRFDLKMSQKLPLIFAIVIIISIWPGLPLTHSLLVSYIDPGYMNLLNRFHLSTWMWYIPLTVLPLLWMIPKQLRQSREAALASAAESIEIIAESLSTQPK